MHPRTNSSIFFFFFFKIFLLNWVGELEPYGFKEGSTESLVEDEELVPSLFGGYFIPEGDLFKDKIIRHYKNRWVIGIETATTESLTRHRLRHGCSQLLSAAALPGNF